MKSKHFGIYLTGVGGQGIGLISEIILRAVDHAGYPVKAVDTHGLAQRGGIVVSQIRMGSQVTTPLIPKNQADLVVALERHEALRGINGALKDHGTIVYYNTVWQPLPVRLGEVPEVSEEMIKNVCAKRRIKIHRVLHPHLEDPRMQNIAVLGVIDRNHLIPGIQTDHFLMAMEDLMSGQMLEKNMGLFSQST